MTDEEIIQEIEAGDAACPEVDWPTHLLCCRPAGHNGLHVATTTYDQGFNTVSRYIVGRWSTDYQPLPNFLLP